MPDFRLVAHDSLKIAVTFGLALSTGLIFHSLSMPAPYLMGSLFGVWAAGGAITALRPYLGVARWFHIPVIIGMAEKSGHSDADHADCVLAGIYRAYPSARL
jgi:hypothetical protein